VSIISCDMREGRTDEHKRALAAGLMEAVRTPTGEPVTEMFLVTREGPGINFSKRASNLPEAVEGNLSDTALINTLHAWQ